jgi:autophagy-related protein 16-1
MKLNFGSSPEAQQKYANMEKRIVELEKEQADLYKTQGQNAQRLVEMVETLKTNEVALRKQQEE